jgi:hypothetical protein
MSQISLIETDRLKGRLIKVANDMLDKYQAQNGETARNGTDFDRVHFGDFAAVAASIAMLTFAGSYERMTNSMSGMVKDLAKQLTTKRRGFFA